ncbi:hypothetical protein [Limnohabitans sp. 2KL-1]|nr:hypothetical protein [Limnohabitans sp. 2KL-1]
MPQTCLRNDRRSAYEQFGMGLREPCAVGYGTFWRCFADALSR